MIINEKQLLQRLDKAQRISLIQPNYKTKYPPLGLAKIKAYTKGKAVINSVTKQTDLICITSLFTYNSAKVYDEINKYLFLGFAGKILLGGVFATLMKGKIHKEYGDQIDIFPGYSKELDKTPPDIEGWTVDDSFKDFCFVFTTRGCVNRCAYCAVHRIEKESWLNPNWKAHIREDKRVVMVSDNNLSSWDKEHIKDVVDTITGQGKQIVFDNGLDCKLIDKEMAEILAKGKYHKNGMRLAFDRIEEDGMFQEAINRLIEAGIAKSNIMAYVLFNFRDTPIEANYRMEVCKELGIRPYPQQFTPLNILTRKTPFIGKYWEKELLRVFRHFWLMNGLWSKHDFFEYYYSEVLEEKPEFEKETKQQLNLFDI